MYHFCIHHLYILNVVIIMMMILINYYAYYDDSIPMKRIRDQHAFLQNATCEAQAHWYQLINCSQMNSAVQS